ncbi:response regulator [Tumebacillus sp. DT12]|uniref:Response regulator n=1 Tax=Tumebacillus lacus TaxID=2995335 RepID=A0ABT3X2W6_9BACL|nr:response regulator [Tumebacillus lacus]MCX7571244.1 response regulator [Tumebacillus lacus]
MSLQFYLIEDDPATRRMLERIVHDGNLGQVIGAAASGSEVDVADVLAADIILIDLLMPGRDGIETIRDLRDRGYNGRFVMISQVENKEMVGEAYLAGVEYFIHKPINRFEVLGVLQRVSEHLTLTQSLSSIRRSLSMLDEFSAPRPHTSSTGRIQDDSSFESHALDLLARLGIAGESGATDLVRLLTWLSRQSHPAHGELPMLKDLYQSFLHSENPSLQGDQLQREIKALEQRLRRTILQALGHLASIGLTDFANPTFEHFAPRLFDFQEVRLRMQEIQAGEKNTKCRLNIKKFISALYAEGQK